MAPSKPTNVEIEALKSALKSLKELQSQVGSTTTEGIGEFGSTVDISGDLGPLCNGAGQTLAAYYHARAVAVHDAILTSAKGVAAAVTLLDNTIKNYEAHEKSATHAATATGTGSGVPASTSATKG